MVTPCSGTVASEGRSNRSAHRARQRPGHRRARGDCQDLRHGQNLPAHSGNAPENVASNSTAVSMPTSVRETGQLREELAPHLAGALHAVDLVPRRSYLARPVGVFSLTA